MQDDKQDALTYVNEEGPNVSELCRAFEQCVNDNEWYSQNCRSNYDYRRNFWPGKSDDLRKHGAGAFPWDGAADSETHVINERINAYVALFLNSLDKANIRAYPVAADDLGRAKVVSSFLKWMIASYIPDFRRQMELVANYGLEKGIMVSYVGWTRQDRRFLQRIELAQLAQIEPELARIIMEGDSDDRVLQVMAQIFPTMSKKRGKKALRDLRKTGFAELPMVRRQVDCPCVLTLAPEYDVFFPSGTADPQRAPYCFWRHLYTAQELRNKISTEGWDADWVEYVIEHGKRESVAEIYERRNEQTAYREATGTSQHLYEVIYAYQRLIDEEDNSEGIYCTVFSKGVEDEAKAPTYAKHELLNGYENYPFVVTKISEDAKRLYDVQAFPEILRGIQWQVKTERDSRADRNSMATVPAVLHPVGTPPPQMAPGAPLAYRRQGEISFGPVPQYNAGSVEMENTMLLQADNLLGLNPENPLSSQKQQFYVTKFLNHVNGVIKMAYRAYQLHGPDELFFRVTGNPDPVKFNRGNPYENFDITVNFDVLSNDPENLEKQLNQLVSLIQIDRNGRINVDALLEVLAGSINPVLADAVLQPAEQASQQVTKNVTDDLTKIAAAIEVPARPNGAGLAMQIIQAYASQPDVQQRLASDEAFRDRMEKYMKQYQFQLQQAQNAQIGRIGTQNASVGQINMQNVPQ